MFGVIGSLLSVVPFGGTALLWVPAVGVLLFQGRYGAAIVLAAIGLIVSTVDNFLKPLLISGRAVVPTLAVFIGVLGGLLAFGVIGMFLGPVVHRARDRPRRFRPGHAESGISVTGGALARMRAPCPGTTSSNH